MGPKKGRPKGPEKVVYKRRVPPEAMEALDALLKKGDWGLDKAKFQESAPVALPKAQNVPEAKERLGVGLPDPFELQEVRKERDELWKTVGEMENEIKALSVALEEARSAGVDELGAYWKGRALRAEVELSKTKESWSS